MEITITAAALLAIVMGLVQVFKALGLPAKFAPLLAILFGIGAAYLGAETLTWQVRIVAGLILGLASVGLYSGPKNIIEGIKETTA